MPVRTHCPSCRHRLSPLSLECPVCGLTLERQALPRPLRQGRQGDLTVVQFRAEAAEPHDLRYAAPYASLGGVVKEPGDVPEALRLLEDRDALQPGGGFTDTIRADEGLQEVGPVRSEDGHALEAGMFRENQPVPGTNVRGPVGVFRRAHHCSHENGLVVAVRKFRMASHHCRPYGEAGLVDFPHEAFHHGNALPGGDEEGDHEK